MQENSNEGSSHIYDSKPVTSEDFYTKRPSTISSNRKQNVYDALNNIKKLGLSHLNDDSDNIFPDVSSILYPPEAFNEQASVSFDNDNRNILKDVEEKDK